MTIKDIRFTGYTTLANCESEPIHVPGTIQPYGVLLAINNQTFNIDFCSSNTMDFFGLEVKAVLGKKLEDIFGNEECENIKRYIKENTSEQFYILTYKLGAFSISFYQQDDLLILEIEPSPDKTLSLPDLYQQSRNFISYLDSRPGLQTLCTLVADEIREITGYDRVMVYRFDKEYNGEVYAESLNDNIESFLGLNYPHTDISPQARALFVRNLLRMIPDVNYEPVPVVTLLQNASNQSVDMSSGGLRSVSPIHIEYLKNMGVGATLTVSLIHNQKLWGLIACHHYSSKIIPPYTRLSIKLHAHFLTSQISNLETAKEYESTLCINEKLNLIINELNKSSFDYTKDNKQLYECLNADGLAIITEKEIYISGKTPGKQQIIDLVNWLDTKTDSDNFVTSRLEGHYPGAIAIKDTASGVFFHSLYKASKQGVLWFRGESEKIITWAGDPEKAIELSQDSLMPRKSFAQWKQVVANTSADWAKWEIDAGVRLATNIQNNLFLIYITREEEKYRLQTQQLQKANEELVNFNFIFSHDLQEPIRKIRVFSNMLLSDNSQEYNKNELLEKINVSALRASKQISDLLKLATISDLSEAIAEVNLDSCLDRIKADFELIIAEKQAAITYGSLGTIKGIPLQIEQLVTNLIGNSLKFSRIKNPHIEISVGNSSPQEIEENTPLNPQLKYVCILVKDNGIGFEQKFAGQIFGIFYRLNHRNSFEGSGIGLAICKKIVDNHNGYIVAKSQKGEGAAFYVYLPQ